MKGGESFCRRKDSEGKFEIFIDPSSASPLEFGTREHPFKSFNWAAMEIHNSMSFDTDIEVSILLKEKTEVRVLKSSLKIMSLKSVEINIYSDS